MEKEILNMSILIPYILLTVYVKKKKKTTTLLSIFLSFSLWYEASSCQLAVV